ncbi:NTP transferase domain-containing protein [Kordiimonas sp.]|uniref:phosphocholine cytidylyltransferase family protein n=1 Tax=Kordiimonas sp. TaxID=1970157 RepID=UPI003B51C2E0
MVEDLLIVAAGMGTRLRAKGNLKPLVEVHGKPLIEYALEAAFEAGLKRATVVGGYKADILAASLSVLRQQRGWEIDLVHNPDYRRSNGLSVLAAREALAGKRFCLAMCDHIVSAELYHRLLAHPLMKTDVALAVDMRLNNSFVDLHDVTKVCMKGPFIREIGKEISVYTAFDTGVFCAGPALFDAISETGRETGDFSISGGMAMLAQNGRALGVDIGDAFWIDVDSPAMHRMASDWISLNQSAIA